MPRRSAPPARQRGAALFIALMFLIILTLIGVSAANVGIMQERMAGSVRDSNIAFQRAEATLRGVEQRIRSITETGGSGGLGTIPLLSDVQASLGLGRGACTLQVEEDASDVDNWPWTASPDVAGAEYLVVELSGGTAGGAIYGSACRPMQSESAGNPGSGAIYYMVAARAPGPTGQAEAVVQSIYFWP
ncbi:MAG: PilX N-terminal domain-containing pilus assembly protein [Wenzhouxiangellaceae bacterium]|nr:PilX N-terminal domain-containing pilus assembly protein [Wenzhouxiangellaceae bacterium]